MKIALIILVFGVIFAGGILTIRTAPRYDAFLGCVGKDSLDQVKCDSCDKIYLKQNKIIATNVKNDHGKQSNPCGPGRKRPTNK